jgi:hypothetical protein
MGVLTLTTKMSSGVNYTHTTASPSDWGSVPNETYFFDITNKVVYFKNVLGSVIGAFDGASSGKIGISDASGSYTFYTTLTLAMAAAVSGNTVELFSDIVETGSVEVALKDGVNINGNGHTYTLNVDDSTNALTCSSGTVELHNFKGVRSGRSNGSTGVALDCTGAIVKSFGSVIINTYGVAVENGVAIYDLSAVAYSHGIKGVTNLYNCRGESIGNGDGIHTSNAFFCEGKAVTGFGFNNQWNIVENSHGKSTSGTAIYSYRPVNSTGISTSGVGIHAYTSGYNCVGISISNYAGQTGGNGSFHNSTLISSSGLATNLCALYNCYAQSSTNVVTNRSNIYNSTIRSLWNSANGHLTNTNVIMTINIVNSTLIVANSSAYCITGYAAGNPVTTKSVWNWSNNTFIGSNAPVNTTNITQGITNTSDTQGNILL